MLDIIDRIVDADDTDTKRSGFAQFKKIMAKPFFAVMRESISWAVGIVANQRLIVKIKEAKCNWVGVIYNDSADKAACFILNCNQKKFHCFLQDVTGFMVGSRSEHAGIIKDGAKLVNAVANSVVPKITIIIGNSYGAGNYAMCGKPMIHGLFYTWPGAKSRLWGGEQAPKHCFRYRLQAKRLVRMNKIICSIR